jgi:hypothetical protein
MLNKTLRAQPGQGKAQAECYIDLSLHHSHARLSFLGYSFRTLISTWVEKEARGTNKGINEAFIVKGDLTVPPTP